jgi:L-ascorbate metabolism protein UlaG (beta-lactamase superfamily)
MRLIEMNTFAKQVRFTWLGHATFLFDTPGGRRVLVDPWVRSNPSTPDAARRIGQLDLMLVTHGHEDHTADAVPIARESGAEVVAPYELALWLEQKGLKRVTGMNLGGTLAVLGLSVTMVPALHSSSIDDGGRRVHLGSAAGYVIGFEDGTTIYFAGDTAVFGDMRLIGELYHPAVAFLPIGDLYTMGPEQAAKACELLAVREVVPMHYGTFPALTGTPARLRALVEPRGVRLLEPIAGEPLSFSSGSAPWLR